MIDLDSTGKDAAFNEVDLYQQRNLSVQQHKNGRKACNCAKSHCLKLYCECFARGQACNGCNCSNCMNNILFENERNKAIKLTLERNPYAFYPKIGSSERKHSKGCNCKRSNCLKNYCECYEARKCLFISCIRQKSAALTFADVKDAGISMNFQDKIFLRLYSASLMVERVR
ncbi:unnamed protein product [Schistocephalus solidus]|uniref:CRC domain-containing protein n=1 Tax=Schistocephalus solidus TaxID=70667 RepID=A0A3P7EAJ1_SCHSO|nr:unnamed protein product [Schistocephalus solidus]